MFVSSKYNEKQEKINFHCQSIFLSTVELGDKELFGHPKIVP